MTIIKEQVQEWIREAPTEAVVYYVANKAYEAGRKSAVSESANTELLDALKGLMAERSGSKKQCGHDFDCVCASDKARAAIAKAESAVSEPTHRTTCTCPSGDGSLRWPCPTHPPTAAVSEPVAWMNSDGDVELSHKNWMVNEWRPLVYGDTAPPAEAKPLTQEQYTALAHRIASKYAHRSDPQYIAYTFLPHTLEQFVRAIEAAHGIVNIGAGK